MATVVFDCDSTLLSCESLEEILLNTLNNNPKLKEKISEITHKGIFGEISFTESLQERLSLISLSKESLYKFASQVRSRLTPGMKELVHYLQQGGHTVWVVSGAPQEVLTPLEEELKIPNHRIHGIKLIFGEHGEYSGIDFSDPFTISKVKGLSSVDFNPKKEISVAVGDGFSDYALYKEKLVDYFVLFTQYVKCDELLAHGVDEANNVIELREYLDTWIN